MCEKKLNENSQLLILKRKIKKERKEKDSEKERGKFEENLQ